MPNDELKDLLPGEDYSLEASQVLRVKAIGFGKLPRFSDAVSNLFKKVQATDLGDLSNMGAVFKVAFEEVVQVMMLVLNKDREWFDGISVADGIGLAEIIVRQNITEKTKKNLAALVSKGGSLLRTQSKPLSAPATDGKTSSDIR